MYPTLRLEMAGFQDCPAVLLALRNRRAWFHTSPSLRPVPALKKIGAIVTHGIRRVECQKVNGRLRHDRGEPHRLLDGKAWTMGTHYTVCDPYALFFYDLGTRIKLPMQELATYAGFSRRMLERSAVSKVRLFEEDISKGANAWHGQYYAQPRNV